MNNKTPKPGTLYTGGNWIMAHSGTYVDVFNPKPEMFLFEDIAEGGAYNFRWRGQSKSKITVAEHSKNVADHATNEADFIAGGFHDASESYLCDLPSPIKANLKLYKEIEYGVMEVIANKFGFAWPLSPAIKVYDKIELEREWRDCMLTYNSPSLSPEDAKKLWIDTFKAYVA